MKQVKRLVIGVVVGRFRATRLEVSSVSLTRGTSSCAFPLEWCTGQCVARTGGSQSPKSPIGAVRPSKAVYSIFFSNSRAVFGGFCGTFLSVLGALEDAVSERECWSVGHQGMVDVQTPQHPERQNALVNENRWPRGKDLPDLLLDPSSPPAERQVVYIFSESTFLCCLRSTVWPCGR